MTWPPPSSNARRYISLVTVEWRHMRETPMELTAQERTPMTQNFLVKIAVMFVLGMIMLLAGCGAVPVALGVKDNHLADCPSSPNCIYTSFSYEGTEEQASAKLLQVLNDYPRCTITQNDGTYIRAEFTTALLRFTDDAEFLIQDGMIQVRSASRVGYSDFGKNRRRMEEVKEAFDPCCY